MATYLAERPLPPTFTRLVVSLAMIIVPALLIAKQPDLGTSILIASSGLIVIFFIWHIMESDNRFHHCGCISITCFMVCNARLSATTGINFFKPGK